MWEFLLFLVVGFIAGVLAKALMPGSRHEPESLILTVLLGVAGAYLFGWLARWLLGWTVGGNLIGMIVSATLGSMLLIGVMRAMNRSRA
jgi:uncharacterized membrane protein YeaQ/YmgE (transglycosylase-associated protein family)